jgi:hypothetical protein
MLSCADLQDWADEDDLARAEIRLLPVVARFASDPGSTQIILGNDLSGRLRAFIEGWNFNVEALRCLLADLREADRSTPRKSREAANGGGLWDSSTSVF